MYQLTIDQMTEAFREFGKSIEGLVDVFRGLFTPELVGMMREAEDIADLKRHAIVLGASLGFFFWVMVTYILIKAF